MRMFIVLWFDSSDVIFVYSDIVCGEKWLEEVLFQSDMMCFRKYVFFYKQNVFFNELFFPRIMSNPPG